MHTNSSKLRKNTRSKQCPLNKSNITAPNSTVQTVASKGKIVADDIIRHADDIIRKPKIRSLNEAAVEKTILGNDVAKVSTLDRKNSLINKVTSSKQSTKETVQLESMDVDKTDNITMANILCSFK